jgi:hypothetical protein
VAVGARISAHFIIAGRDPAIFFGPRETDTRVKPAYDEKVGLFQDLSA